MDQICRLCLTITENMACKLGEETKLMNNLSSLNIQILINKSLPSLVCCFCSKTLDDFINYRENIIQNQYKLTQQLNNDTILDSDLQNLEYENIKTEEVDYEDNFKQTVYFESETIISTKSNEFHYEIPSNIDIVYDETVFYESIEPEDYTEKKITCKKKSLKKQEERTHKNDKIQDRKRKTKRIQNQTKSNAIERSIEIEYDITHKIIEEDVSNLKTTKYNETESKLIKNSILIENELDMKIEEHKCLTCFQNLRSNSELINHYKSIHDNVDKENEGTDFIQISSDDKNDIRNNENEDISLSEKAKRPFNCKICGRTFPSVYDIVRHARAHSDCSLFCSQGCGYSTVYRGALTEHEKRHKKDFKYKCATCSAGFNAKTSYEQHENVHKNIKPFVCDVCGMAFHMNRYLSSHRGSVHTKVIKGVKRFMCPHCDLALVNARCFRRHLEEHVGKKTFLCDLCGKECSSSEQLKYHNNSHLGLKPFECSICNKRFAKKFNLSVHQRAHAGEKHLCQECGKHFAQRSTLLRHRRKCHPDSKTCRNELEPIVNK